MDHAHERSVISIFRASAGFAIGYLWAEVLNRQQDQMDLYFIDARSGKSRKVLTETSPEAG